MKGSPVAMKTRLKETQYSEALEIRGRAEQLEPRSKGKILL